MADLGELEFLRYIWVDNANVIRSKTVPVVGRSRGHLERAVRISQAQMALPVVADEVIPAAGLLPTHDVTLMPDWSSVRPLWNGYGAVACDMYDGDEPWQHCPRSFLRRMDDRARAAGFEVRCGVELEFMLLRDGRPIDASAFCQDSAYDTDEALMPEIIAALALQGLEVATFHPESGPGQWEIALRHSGLIDAADAVVAVRQTVRAISARHGISVSFLPLLTVDGAGSGMHVHLSLTGDDNDGLGPQGAAFMAGILDNLEPLLAVVAPSIVSLHRYRPHYWVGAFQGWGEENKEAPLRVVPTDSGTPRDVEFKAGDATANPYVMLGCLLAAGLDGVARESELPDPIEGDPGLLSDEDRRARGIEPMPMDPREVLAALERSDVLAEAMGPLHTSYCAVHRVELDRLQDLPFDEQVVALVDRY